MSDHWKKGACVGLTKLFFPVLHEAASKIQIREAKAKAVCATCVVQAECLVEARTNPEAYIDLVMGGLAYEERVARPSRSSRGHSRMQRTKEAKRDGSINQD